ncbi:MAG: hypothetical protein GKR91_05840 [Pseudomonadales bacterium]|nr:hypothetical protein [Pseudomonadales bacterium]
MTTRKHEHAEVFNTTPENLFSLLYTPSAIRQWWSADRAIVLPEVGGLWSAAWRTDEDNPDYMTIATITDFEPPSRLLLTDYRYHSKDGELPFEANFTNEFIVTPHAEGASLKVIQDGFPAGSEGDEFLKGCEVGWRETFKGIHRYLGEHDEPIL